MSLKCVMYLGDCLDVMPKLAAASTQIIFADLPYGATGHSWDVCLELSDLRPNFERLSSGSGPYILPGNERFYRSTSNSWSDIFRYSVIWDKDAPCNWLQANKRPLVTHEFIGVYGKTPAYNPVKTKGTYARTKKIEKNPSRFIRNFHHRAGFKANPITLDRHPKSIISFKRDKEVRRGYTHGRTPTHPSQKPVALLDWLIRTYSNPGNTVLDPVGGSGTTAIAALSCGRNVTCIEKDPTYFEASVERVRKHVQDGNLDVDIEMRR